MHHSESNPPPRNDGDFKEPRSGVTNITSNWEGLRLDMLKPGFIQPRILTYRELAQVPVNECQEPMRRVQDLAPEIICEYQQKDMIPYCGHDMYLREGAINRLRQAFITLQALRPELGLKVVYAYRHPEIQQKYFEEVSAKIRSENSELQGEALFDAVHPMVAVLAVAGHPTGAAVDVTLTLDGINIPMGTGIADFSKPELIPTTADGISEQERANRMLLRYIMSVNGFAPFDGEWWHFSYGDREWAALTGNKEARYSPVLPGDLLFPVK